MNDAAIALARALKGAVIGGKARAFIQKWRDSGLVLDSELKLKNHTVVAYMTAVAHADNGAGNGRQTKDIFRGDMTRQHAAATGGLGKQREQLLV